MRCRQAVVPFKFLFPTGPILFMNTVISTYSAFCCLLSPHLQMATCGRPFKSLWWKKSSSYCSYTTCMHRTDYHPLKSYNLKALFVDRRFPLHFLGIGKSSFVNIIYKMCRLCCSCVGFIFLSYRYQGTVHQLRTAPHSVPEKHGAVFLELRSGLWLKLKGWHF